jgi:hypothetical protein
MIPYQVIGLKLKYRGLAIQFLTTTFDRKYKGQIRYTPIRSLTPGHDDERPDLC